MSIEIETTLSLNQFQTILGFMLNIIGITWFFLLSNLVKARTLNLFLKEHKVPVMETIVPSNVMDVYKMLSLHRKWTVPVAFINIMVIFGLILTIFDGLIVINSINEIETCKTITVTTQAQITNSLHRAAYGSYAELSEMMQKRTKSGVPDDALIGQIPIDSRWKFNARLDVDPYPWRSACTLYKAGFTKVNMNTSVLYAKSTLINAFPEVHAEYKFRNSPNGYNYTRDNYNQFLFYNRTNSTERFQSNGAIMLAIEEFTRGNDTELIGFEYINRLWTLRIPETFRFPYNPDKNDTEFEIVSTSIAVKVYTCKVERVKEGEDGGYNFLLRYIDADVDISGVIIGRDWNLAVINGHDTSIYEYSPAHWTSYLAVKDTQTASIENVPVQISTSCISVHSAYIILMVAYIIMFIIGWLFRRKIRKKFMTPDTVVEWASFAYKINNFRNLSNYKIKRGIRDDGIIVPEIVSVNNESSEDNFDNEKPGFIA
ncbi:hypothetical protein F8M41_016678 [Gigaspora margarita]|uniref:Uncharacterized protein n=1 Tax=Gigaspora margarita TaxID=4874 RepID=A0A8H4EMF6_GIGMA|nr:hypothetical protein F8M41_016678 [Gigaspora margarita]